MLYKVSQKSIQLVLRVCVRWSSYLCHFSSTLHYDVCSCEPLLHAAPEHCEVGVPLNVLHSWVNARRNVPTSVQCLQPKRIILVKLPEDERGREGSIKPVHSLTHSEICRLVCVSPPGSSFLQRFRCCHRIQSGCNRKEETVKVKGPWNLCYRKYFPLLTDWRLSEQLLLSSTECRGWKPEYFCLSHLHSFILI